jgi:hypothetical protein
VEKHLCKHGFRDDYRIWTSHGESHIEVGSDESFDEADQMDDMLVDLGGGHAPTFEEEPTGSAANLLLTFSCGQLFPYACGVDMLE